MSNFFSKQFENEINVGNRNSSKYITPSFIENILKEKVEEQTREQSKKRPNRLQLPTLDYQRKKTQLKYPQVLVRTSKKFIISGDLPDIKQALLKRGWLEISSQNNQAFDFKWSIKKKDIDFSILQENQIVNRFQKISCIAAKNGLCRTLRDLYYHSSNPDHYYPKCYDISDATEFLDFIEEFKFLEAYKILAKFVQIISKFNQSFSLSIHQYFLTHEKIILTCLNILQRHTHKIDNLIEQFAKQGNLFLEKRIKEWELIANHKDNKNSQVLELLVEIEIQDNTKIEPEESEKINNLVSEVQTLIKIIEESDPQISLFQGQNIWIMKPGGLSRGRGIICLNDLRDIHYCLNSTNIQWVCQKYIENPLIIHGKKFDIRQWILVTDWSPLTIWFYDECYIRFGAEEYNDQNLSNKFAHLTNNSIAKYSNQFKTSIIKENMWSQQEFADYLHELEGNDIFQQIHKKLKFIVNNALLSAVDNVEHRKNTFELFGFDFMINNLYQPWLIEINTSPDLSYSTKITKRLVQMASEDIIKVVLDVKFNNNENANTGNFKCIYKGKSLI